MSTLQVDRATRVIRPLSGIAAVDAPFRRLLAYVEARRRGGLLARSQDIDRFALVELVGGWFHIVDTSAADALNFRFSLYGAEIPLGGYADFTSHRLGDMPHRQLVRLAAEDYADVAATGTARYQLVKVDHRGEHREYSRLIVPLAEDGRRVDRLIVAINERELLELDEARRLSHGIQRGHLRVVE